MDKILFDLQKVSFSYKTKEVIREISTIIEPGKFYGIVGPNGSGKTTLLMLLMGKYKPSNGKILFMGKDMLSYPRKVIARNIALVPQLFKSDIPYTVEEIVLMGRYPYMGRFPLPSKTDKEIVEKIMEDMKISHLKNRFITTLSGGERQLVIFARALAQDTPAILLDEATSNLDIRHTLRTLNIVRNKVKKEGKTVISVFHDINLALMYVDEIIFIKYGKILSKGNKKKILNAENIKKTFEVDCSILTLDEKLNQVVFDPKTIDIKE